MLVAAQREHTMVGIKWTSDFETGDEGVDFQHKHLFALINELNDAVQSGSGESVVRDVLLDFVRYTKKHFKTEEVLMEASGFPDLDAHRVEHERVEQEVRGLAECTSSVDAMRLSEFAYDWLMGHIVPFDVPMIRFVRERSQGDGEAICDVALSAGD